MAFVALALLGVGAFVGRYLLNSNECKCKENACKSQMLSFREQQKDGSIREVQTRYIEHRMPISSVFNSYAVCNICGYTWPMQSFKE